MSINKYCRLRCNLCKRGLLYSYNVYDVPVDDYGAVGTPILYSSLSGYFYKKSGRTIPEILDIPGNIKNSEQQIFRIIAFEKTFKSSDLVDIGGMLYKITDINEWHDSCYIITLEEWTDGFPH